MAEAFSFDRVSKRFGKTEALKEFSLAVPRGSVVGLVGRNGAGKSTAIRCLVGLQRPDLGSVTLFGEDPWQLSIEAKRRLGYMSERELPFGGARVGDLIAFCAPLYPTWDASLERDILSRFRIEKAAKMKSLSLGQQRTVALLLALCPRPEVLVMDEPAANLDPVMRREFLEQVLELVADEGRTVLFSSHILSDVERVANRIAFIHRGRLLLHRETDDLKDRMRRIRLIFDREPIALPEIPEAVRTRKAGRELLVTVDGFDEALVTQIVRRAGATRFEVQPLGLEELFIDLVGDLDSARDAA